MSAALRVENLRITFGGVTAVDDVTLEARRGEILSIIGPNGAGKTTLFNMISGLYRPNRGRIFLGDTDVSALRPFQLARLGMSRTFQNLQIFLGQSVVENVMIGRCRWERTSLLADLLGLPSVARQNAQTRAKALEALERVGMASFADQPASTLSYGQLKRLEIARALANEPTVLLLDEPAAGCNAVETGQIEQIIRGIAGSDVAIVLIEHDMKMVMRLSNNVFVLCQGRMLAHGTPADVRANPDVVAAYLGTHASEVEHAAH